MSNEYLLCSPSLQYQYFNTLAKFQFLRKKIKNPFSKRKAIQSLRVFDFTNFLYYIFVTFLSLFIFHSYLYGVLRIIANHSYFYFSITLSESSYCPICTIFFIGLYVSLDKISLETTAPPILFSRYVVTL